MTAFGANSASPISQVGTVVDALPQKRNEFWRRISRRKINLVCLGIVFLYALLGLSSLFPYLDGKIEEHPTADKTYTKPSFSYVDPAGVKHIGPATWFGLDFQGRSVFWRVLYGTRVALVITIVASIISLSIGTLLGIVAGYFGGWIDDVITWLFSVISTVPWLLLVIAVTYALQQNMSLSDKPQGKQGVFSRDLIVVILALGLTDWVGLCRLIRGEVIKLRDRDYIVACRAIGVSHARTIFKHILPNVFHLIIITFSLGAVGYLQVEVVLAFLGLGVTSKPSWGRMIDDAKLALLQGVWWEVTAATLAIFIICLALNILGDALRDALDPKLRGVD